MTPGPSPMTYPSSTISCILELELDHVSEIKKLKTKIKRYTHE